MSRTQRTKRFWMGLALLGATCVHACTGSVDTPTAPGGRGSAGSSPLDAASSPDASHPDAYPLAESPEGAIRPAAELVAVKGEYLFYSGCFEADSLCFSFPNRIQCAKAELVLDSQGQLCVVCDSAGEKSYRCHQGSGDEASRILAQISGSSMVVSFESGPGLQAEDCAEGRGSAAGCAVLPNPHRCDRLTLVSSDTGPVTGTCQKMGEQASVLKGSALPLSCSAGSKGRTCVDLANRLVFGQAGDLAGLYGTVQEAGTALGTLFDQLLGATAFVPVDGQAKPLASYGDRRDPLQPLSDLIGQMKKGQAGGNVGGNVVGGAGGGAGGNAGGLSLTDTLKLAKTGLSIASAVLSTICKFLNESRAATVVCQVADTLGAAARAIP